MHLLVVKDLRKTFKLPGGFLNRDVIHAVNGVTFAVCGQSIFGLIGESGCGKTTTARCILKLEEVSSGEIWYSGTEIGGLGETAFKPFRKRIQMAFQDPLDSLNPRFTVRKTLQEPLDVNTKLSRSQKREKLIEMMETVGLREEHLSRYPQNLSAGQQQRVGLARAVICDPELVVLDEPTAALDMSVRGRVLELLCLMREQFGITYLLISHDLMSVSHLCSTIAVMYLGFIVEIASTTDVLHAPAHPYTQALVSSAPRLDSVRGRKRTVLKGEVSSAVNIPTGCPFSERCPIVEDICLEERPPLIHIAPERMVACHKASDEDHFMA